MISSQHVTVSSQGTTIYKCKKPIKSGKQPTSNIQQPTQNGTQPISNFKQHKNYSLGPKSNSIGNILINSQQVMVGEHFEYVPLNYVCLV